MEKLNESKEVLKTNENGETIGRRPPDRRLAVAAAVALQLRRDRRSYNDPLK